MSDPILLFLTVDAVALLLLGLCATVLPAAAVPFAATAASGLGTLLCLPPLLLRGPAATLVLPIGPPGLSLHLALDPLSAFVLVIVFLSGTAIAAYQSTATRSPGIAELRVTAALLAGTTLTLVAADAVTLAFGLAIIGAAHGRQPVLLTPFLLLAATCLLTPAGFAPSFDTIRAAPVDPTRATIAAALTFAAVAVLMATHRGALTAGLFVPTGSYLLLRLIADLPGPATQTATGFVLLLAGGAIAIIEAWRAAAHPDIDGAAACLARRQAGLATAGIGLALIARSADLPGAESFALAATLLAALGSGLGATVTALAARAIVGSAGTARLSRLGGLIHTMPATSAALAAGLISLSALPPGLGFACLWLLFEAILSAPRIGGLPFQLPLALIGAALALSAAVATAAAVRLIGVPLLGRPRTPRGAGAREQASPSRTILLTLAALSALAGALPGLALWLLAEPAIHALAGTPPGNRIGLAVLVSAVSSPGYLSLPVLAVLTLATGAAMLLPRWSRKEAKLAAPWTDGMPPPEGLPFGEPAAQSAGRGFLPNLPYVPMPPRPQIPALPQLRPPSANAGLWLLLAASAVLLLLLALIG